MKTTMLAATVAALLAAAAGLPSTALAQDMATPLIPRDALFGNPERSNVQLSPDGQYISWTAPVGGVMNVWVAPASDMGKAKAITRDTGRGIRQYFWSYQPGTLLYLRDTGGNEDFHLFALDVASGTARDLTDYPKTRAYVSGVSSLHPESVVVGLNDRDARWHDLYRIDLKSGKRTLLQKNSEDFASIEVDDSYTVRMASKQRADGGIDYYRPDGKGGWTVFDSFPYGDSMTSYYGGYTVDGKTLYLTDSRDRDTAALYAIDTATGKRTLLADDDRADVGDVLRDPRTGQIQAVSVDYQRNDWKVLDPRIAPAMAEMRKLGPGDVWVASRTLDDKNWIVAYGAAEQPVVYYQYTPGSGKAPVKLLATRPALEGQPLVPMYPQVIPARDGLGLVSYLTLPKAADANADGKADRPVPMVLLVHGGPWARDMYGYNSYHQWLANRGYAVLSVNYRGSTGFGKDYVNKGDLEWAGKMHDDLIDAVDWAVKQGVTRPEDVAIMGGSYGGYATLVGLTFTPDRFKCGVDIVGPSNLNTLLKTIPPYWASMLETWAKRMGDPRTEAGRKLLDERSPLSRVDAITKPLLIGQGANDPRVKQSESDQIVAAMKAKNIPVTYVLFPDEGHGFQRPPNSKAFNAVAEGFLSQCLGGRAQPIGDDFAGSSIGVSEGAAYVPGLEAALKSHTPAVKK
ncbi:S9 family peptidase [Lysobacter oculi]|uniref:S9 family peptidase n=1 Tax=Solilutibacter oculi TaxID=2698682 RepID=A0A344J776_9GAMM|nr:S9 family peptidase [Lysobacter oculi]